MARQIDSLVFAEWASPADIFSFHYNLSQVVGQGGNAQRKPIAGAELERFREVIHNRRNPFTVRIRITLKSIGLGGEIFERLEGSKLLCFNRSNWHKALINSPSDWTAARGPHGFSDPPPRHVPTRFRLAVSGPTVYRVQPASREMMRCLVRAKWPPATRFPRCAAYPVL